MKKDIIKLEDIEVTKVWQPTMMLRWMESDVYLPSTDEFRKKLQQAWTSNLGNIEWKDIPVEYES
jgi:hypothetical protein